MDRAPNRFDTVADMGIPAVGATHEENVRFTQHQFDAFARLSGDDNPIHVDPDFAARTHFGATVAHGMMLFGVLSAAVTRWLDAPWVVHSQELMFPAPTFSERDHQIRLVVRDLTADRLGVGQLIVDPDGAETAVGEVLMRVPEVPGDAEAATRAALPSDSDEYKGLRLGMRAAHNRRFTQAEVDEYCDLVDERQNAFREGHLVPPALLGGAVSHLLGVKLPGPGSNWLKQRFDFFRPVWVTQEVMTEVEIVRFRPGKDLVNLACTLVLGDDQVATGNSLVHTQDVEPR